MKKTAHSSRNEFTFSNGIWCHWTSFRRSSRRSIETTVKLNRSLPISTARSSSPPSFQPTMPTLGRALLSPRLISKQQTSGGIAALPPCEAHERHTAADLHLHRLPQRGRQ